MISKKEIYLYQEKWANGIVSIGKLKDDYDQCKKKTLKFISNLYGFENGTVQFKPTKASDNQFRNNLHFLILLVEMILLLKILALPPIHGQELSLKMKVLT